MSIFLKKKLETGLIVFENRKNVIENVYFTKEQLKF